MALITSEGISGDDKLPGAHASHDVDHSTTDILHFLCVIFVTIWKTTQHVEDISSEI